MHACKQASMHTHCSMGWGWTTDECAPSMMQVWWILRNENCRYSWLKSIRLHYYSLAKPSPCYSTWATVAALSFRIFPFSCIVARCFTLFAISFQCCFLSHGFLFFTFCWCFLMPEILSVSFYSGLLIVVPNSKKPNCARSNATISIHLLSTHPSTHPPTHTHTSLSHPS